MDPSGDLDIINRPLRLNDRPFIDHSYNKLIIMDTIYDLIGIGIGPFNLGLAALSQTNTSLSSLFIDQNEGFNWHSGMMLKGAKLQVPFHADLVTLVDPRNKYSFLSYLQAKRRLFRFTIREEYFPLRSEYDDYCKWVADQLTNLRFSLRCMDIDYDSTKGHYIVSCMKLPWGHNILLKAKRLVIGIGTSAHLPSFVNKDLKGIIHSSRYKFHKQALLDSQRITIIGSGQSAAEIFDNLLDEGQSPYWFTRSPRFFPMDYSKFALEMTSPDYIQHFYQLNQDVKQEVLQRQAPLYKGINKELISGIYDKLYERNLSITSEKHPYLFPNCALMDIKESNGWLNCSFLHQETKQTIQHKTMHLIMATGYKYDIPKFLLPIRDRIQWTSNGQFAVSANYHIDQHATLFVQNAEMHSHGYNTPDLGMGPYRNAIILNTILGKKKFSIEENVPFQGFRGPLH
jgi:lysine N6-hydroxylase